MDPADSLNLEQCEESETRRGRLKRDVTEAQSEGARVIAQAKLDSARARDRLSKQGSRTRKAHELASMQAENKALSTVIVKMHETVMDKAFTSNTANIASHMEVSKAHAACHMEVSKAHAVFISSMIQPGAATTLHAPCAPATPAEVPRRAHSEEEATDGVEALQWKQSQVNQTQEKARVQSSMFNLLSLTARNKTVLMTVYELSNLLRTKCDLMQAADAVDDNCVNGKLLLKLTQDELHSAIEQGGLGLKPLQIRRIQHELEFASEIPTAVCSLEEEEEEGEQEEEVTQQVQQEAEDMPAVQQQQQQKQQKASASDMHQERSMHQEKEEMRKEKHVLDENVLKWEKEAVAMYVGQMKAEFGEEASKYASNFVEDYIDGRALLNLSDENLKELGLPMGHRMLMLEKIANIKTSAAKKVRFDAFSNLEIAICTTNFHATIATD